MVFRAADPAMLKAVKPGDKVRFVPDRINGQFTITKIEKPSENRTGQGMVTTACRPLGSPARK